MEDYQLLTRILTPAVIGIALYAVVSLIFKEKEKELVKSLGKEHVVIRLPRAYLWVGIIGTIAFLSFLILMILFPFDTASIWVGALFGAFIFVGLVLIFVSLVWRIDVFRNESYFIYVSGFGRTHKIHYAEIVSFEEKRNNLVIRMHKKWFFIDLMANNLEVFQHMLVKNKVKEHKRH